MGLIHVGSVCFEGIMAIDMDLYLFVGKGEFGWMAGDLEKQVLWIFDKTSTEERYMDGTLTIKIYCYT